MYDGMSDPLGESQVLPYLRGLRNADHQISIVSFEKKKYESRTPQIASILAGLGIKWFPLRYTKQPPILSTVYDIQRLQSLSNRLNSTEKFDVIHCRSYVAALAGLSLKKKFRDQIKFVFDMRGFWPDWRVEEGAWPQNRLPFRHVYRFFKKKEVEFLRYADSVISLTAVGKRILEDWGVSSNKITVIPCCVDTDLFNPNSILPTDSSELRIQLGINENDLCVGYLGSLYLPVEVLRFFKAINETFEHSKLLVISREDRAKILRIATDLNISHNNIIVRGVDRECLPKLLSIVDLGVSFIPKRFSSQGSSPTKLGEMMAMGIPLFCNSGVGDVDNLINRTSSGVLLDGFSNENYSFGVSQVPSLLKRDRFAIRQSAITELSLKIAVERYKDVYNSVSRNY